MLHNVRMPAILLLLFGLPCLAQFQVRATGGAAIFLDEDFPSHKMIGGSLRLPLTRRLGLEPEVLYLRQSDLDDDVILAPNLTFDLTTRKRAIPYLIGGPGWLRHRGGFPGRRFTTSEWTVSGGLGLRLFLADHLFLAPEARIGWEPLFRVTFSIGYSF